MTACFVTRCLFDLGVFLDWGLTDQRIFNEPFLIIQSKKLFLRMVYFSQNNKELFLITLNRKLIKSPASEKTRTVSLNLHVM